MNNKYQKLLNYARSIVKNYLLKKKLITPKPNLNKKTAETKNWFWMITKNPKMTMKNLKKTSHRQIRVNLIIIMKL